MKKYIIIASFLLISCNDKEVNQAPIQEEIVLDYQDTKKVDSLLETVDGIKTSVAQVIHEKQSLKLDNVKLKSELVMVKDCLQVANEKIKEYKVPKKRSFFDKVLGKNKDSITVKDTLK